ncbi:MAG TPA: hypothetical protein DET40_19620 [Lentisphaeria bacterium]|nr:MAG: hypothetical protein A2X45_11260 [Lentisphaerae bacterium GWF2_50_93]HCE45758.1 hypothetical protein [Lentisphaeria bacterium]
MQNYLREFDKRFDSKEAMLSEKCHSPGYHTMIPDGVIVHSTRENLQYAICLLEAGGVKDFSRAEKVIRKILSLQDTDPFSKTYGIWSWYFEEPLDKMNPPDWNWADFLGARMAHIIRHYSGKLPADLVSQVRESLGHAGWCIFRRNVHLGYSNIAIMGGGVAAAAGEILDEPRLLDFGRERLRRVVELLSYNGTFSEYNSPTYTFVALEEAERILDLVEDRETRKHAEDIRHAGWKVISDHFHPATQQWGGAQSRAYSNFIGPHLSKYLSEQTNTGIKVHPSLAKASPRLPSFIPELPCPVEFRKRFTGLPSSPLEFKTRFIRRDENKISDANRKTRNAYGDRVGTTWMDDSASLGSINHEDTWTQRRFAFGHWKTESDPAVCLRVRFMHDGRDFCSGLVRNSQKGPRVLSAITMILNRGDFHPHFDHPKDDVFQAKDFRLRYELTGKGVEVEKIGRDRFVLSAGNCRAVIHAVPGKFGPNKIKWETGMEKGRAFVDAVCHHGKRKGFNFGTMGTVELVSGLELIGETQKPVEGKINIKRVKKDIYSAEWAGLKLVVPAAADNYPD